MIIGGLDLSKNHYALILKDLNSAMSKIYIGWHTLSAVKKWEKKFSEYVFHYLPTKGKGETQEHYDMEQGMLLAKCIRNDIVNFIRKIDEFWYMNSAEQLMPVIIALEGYAYRAYRSIDLAEVTRSVKEMIYKNYWAIRIHDPQSIKLWAGRGNYDKKQMVRQARRHIDIPQEFSVLKSGGIATDIADAYFLMIMLEVEIAIRKDPIQMRHLNEKQLQVMNRTTRTQPVNLLNRDFLSIEQPKLITEKRNEKKREMKISLY